MVPTCEPTSRHARVSTPGGSATPRLRVLRAAIVAASLALLIRPAGATIVGGGGNEATDCLTVFDAAVNDPASKPRNVRCTDGDLACDADGTVNGVCEFPLAVCANSTFDAACTLNGVQSILVEHAADNGDSKFDPEFQALATRIANEIDPLPTTTADFCTAVTNFRVAIKGPFGGTCKKNSKLVKLVTVSKLIGGKFYTDKDKIKLTCDPDPNGCDPQILFTGTFDRVQQQIFNQSCALSGCHDSQSKTGNLLLETGASYGNLINVTPTNGPAAAAGWKRVTVSDPMTGDPQTSLLYAKVSGPPDGFGARMPFNRKPIDRRLVDVIQLWIAAGAPDTGWVPGTD